MIDTTAAAQFATWGAAAEAAEVLTPAYRLSVTRFAPDTLPYRELAAALECAHARRDQAGGCRTVTGCFDGWPALSCQCGTCGHIDPARPHTANPFSKADAVDVAPMPGAQVIECPRVACANQGNGRECWWVRTADGQAWLFEMPDRDTAERIAREGGRISVHHRLRAYC